MQNCKTEPFYQNIKRLSSKNAFRAAARAILIPLQPRETRHFTQKSRIFAATQASQALQAAFFRKNR
jgi:hypothetical protein